MSVGGEFVGIDDRGIHEQGPILSRIARSMWSNHFCREKDHCGITGRSGTLCHLALCVITSDLVHCTLYNILIGYITRTREYSSPNDYRLFPFF